MKNGAGAYVQAYNAQAVVDDAHQVITAADITGCASDLPVLHPDARSVRRQHRRPSRTGRG
jgi:hypothetical protein